MVSWTSRRNSEYSILDLWMVNVEIADFRSRTSIGALTLHICKDLKSKFIGGDFITDSFTTKYSDHKPIYIILK